MFISVIILGCLFSKPLFKIIIELKATINIKLIIIEFNKNFIEVIFLLRKGFSIKKYVIIDKIITKIPTNNFLIISPCINSVDLAKAKIGKCHK